MGHHVLCNIKYCKDFICFVKTKIPKVRLGGVQSPSNLELNFIYMSDVGQKAYVHNAMVIVPFDFDITKAKKSYLIKTNAPVRSYTKGKCMMYSFQK